MHDAHLGGSGEKGGSKIFCGLIVANFGWLSSKLHRLPKAPTGPYLRVPSAGLQASFFLLSSSRIPSGMSDAGYCALNEPLLSSWHVIRPCSQQMGHLGHLWIGKGNSSWCVYQDPATAPAPCHGTSSGQESQAC